jgi:ubiquitin carboxyl-terminal hydrolase 34
LPLAPDDLLLRVLTSTALDPELPASVSQLLNGPLLDRLLEVLFAAAPSDTSESASQHASLCFQCILESCSRSDTFMSAFCAHPRVPGLIKSLLLNDPREAVRQNTVLLIRQKTSPGEGTERYANRVYTPVSRILSSPHFSSTAPMKPIKPQRSSEVSSGR